MQLFKRILYATDMADDADLAAHYAPGLSHECGARLKVVNVVSNDVEEMSANMSYDLASHYDGKRLDRFVKDKIDRSTEVLIARFSSLCDDADNQLSDFPVRPQVSIRAGDPVEQIVLEA